MPGSFSPNLLAANSLDQLKSRLEREFIIYHLRRLGGDTLKMSKFLGVGRKYFCRRCRKLGIRIQDWKNPS